MTITNLIFIFIILILSILTILLKKQKPPALKNTPPGPPKLPIIGNLHQLISNTTPPHHRLHQLSMVYGPIMHLHLGEIPAVVVSSADVAREVMRTHDAELANRPKLVVGKELYYDYSDIALAPYGEYWRQVRKIATLELFTAKRVGLFRPIREEEVANLVKSIGFDAAHGKVVNLSHKLFSLAFDITSRSFAPSGLSRFLFMFNSFSRGSLVSFGRISILADALAAGICDFVTLFVSRNTSSN